MSDTTDWKARAELLEARFREETEKLNKRIGELALDLDHWRERAQCAEHRIVAFAKARQAWIDARDALGTHESFIHAAAEDIEERAKEKR